MKHIIHFIALFLINLISLSAHGAFIVHDVNGKITVNKDGQEIVLKSGMKVIPADQVTIPKGGKLEIRNDINHNIYTSTSNGTFTISRMMLDAKVASDNNISAINSRLKVGGASPDKGQRVYVEQGMVKRSLSEYDPQASMFSIDPVTLARCIREKNDSNCSVDSTFVDKLERSPDGSLAIGLVNVEAFPIYFNIISLDENEYSLSCLGQPVSSYVLLPRQSIIRTHPDHIDPSQKQILIMANCSFDVDMLLEELNKTPVTDTDPIPDFPLHIYYF